MKFSSNCIDQIGTKRIACHNYYESEEAELTPSFTFGVIDDSNISEEVLAEGVHAQKPTEIQRIADNMSNNPLSTQKKVKKLSEVKKAEVIYDKEELTNFYLNIPKDCLKPNESSKQTKSSAHKVSLKEEIHDLCE